MVPLWMALNQGCSGQKMSHKLCFCQFLFFKEKPFLVWFLGIFGGFRVSLIFFSFSLLLFHFHKEAGLHFTPGIFEKTKKRIFCFFGLIVFYRGLIWFFCFTAPKRAF